jgi:hypothetical protein
MGEIEGEQSTISDGPLTEQGERRNGNGARKQ